MFRILVSFVYALCFVQHAHGELELKYVSPDIDVANLASSIGIQVFTYDFEPGSPYCLQVVVETKPAEEPAILRDAGVECGLAGPSRFTIHHHRGTPSKLVFFTNSLSDGAGGSTGLALTEQHDDAPAWFGSTPEQTLNLIEGRKAKVVEIQTRSKTGEATTYSVFVTLHPNVNATLGSGYIGGRDF